MTENTNNNGGTNYVRFKNLLNGKFMSAPEGAKAGSWIYCNGVGTPLQFTQNGSDEDCVFKLNGSDLYLSFKNSSGAVKLHPSSEEASFTLKRYACACSIFNIHFKQFMWLKGEEPYVTGAGNPENTNALWVIEPA
ncbi:hypothetical protein [Undibacterium curvum]|uniref:hypothetical protein n=1 Tax=Undibacterium curvum TaxID=2762294 RepID=UPI003D1221CA